MVEQVFRLGDRPVNALVTPRPDIVWRSEGTEENRQKVIAHSRFPVCQGGLDNVLGMLHVTDLLGRSVSQALDLTVSLRQPICQKAPVV